MLRVVSAPERRRIGSVAALSGDWRVPGVSNSRFPVQYRADSTEASTMIVRKLRLQRGWTQEHLAELTGLSVRSIQRLERGQSGSLEMLNSLAAVFEVDRSLFKPGDNPVPNTAPISAEEENAIQYVRGVKEFYSHMLMYLFFVAIFGFFFGFKHPLILWGSIGWGIGLVVHGLNVFEVINFFGPTGKRSKSKSASVDHSRGSRPLVASRCRFGRRPVKGVTSAGHQRSARAIPARPAFLRWHPMARLQLSRIVALLRVERSLFSGACKTGSFVRSRQGLASRTSGKQMRSTSRHPASPRVS